MRLKSQSCLTLFLFCSLLFVLSSCKKNEDETNGTEPEISAPVNSYDDRVIDDWQNLFLKIERHASGYHPCPTARMLAYTGLGAYESVVSGMPDYKSIAFLYPGLTLPTVEKDKAYHFPTVINNYYALLFKHFYANVQASDLVEINSLENFFNGLYSASVDGAVFDRSKVYGASVANAIWNYSSSDAAGHNKYTDPRPSSYAPPVGDGKWKPTSPGNEAALFPYWGSTRNFALGATNKICNAPLPYSTSNLSPYYAQALEVYSKTTPQTPENQWIAEFWSDDVPCLTFSTPARWIAITNQVIEIEHSSLERAVILAMKMGIAINDATLAAWASKYYYAVERPQTYIQEVMLHPDWNIYDLTSTNFLNSTPSYPSYPSAHAVIGAAAAEVLTSVFGDNYQFTDRCHQNRNSFNGTPRSFNSFYEMAEENAISRVYLGLNFPMDCSEGVRFGYEIGKKVNALPYKN